ncbi:2096_t:CDS:1 [Ambispora gerdemannii]|uniref:2096_t:CDS:1 n=1 Tax=Ambispora gerdemannii TaxID=144530 RepID=A0A9N9ACI2_9GLOM|nr:2096_t:CDS:1 [Ambispora gerdemannii]
MNRGESLVKDLKIMLNNSRYSDIKIKCSDSGKDNNEILYGCRMILAARCEFFEKMFFTGMRETHEPEISLPEISTAAMKVVLEFLYTGNVENNKLTATNAIDVFYAANYLLLPVLEEVTVSFIEGKIFSENDNISIVRLFSAMITKADAQKLDKGQFLYKLLCKKMKRIPLFTFAFNEMSIDMLKVLLSQTLDQDEYFATSEYGIFRYVVLWGANKVSPQTLFAYSKVLPIADSVDKFCDEFIQKNEELIEESNFSNYRHQLLKQIDQLLPLIDLQLINVKIIGLIIDPLRLFSLKCVNEAYRLHAISKHPTKTTRGAFVNKQITWNKLQCGPHMIVHQHDETVVESFTRGRSQMAIAKQAFKGKDIFQWDIVIEQNSQHVAIGVISSTEIEQSEPEFSKSLIWQPDCWCISSDGSYYSKLYHIVQIKQEYELAAFKEGDTVTSHLDMSERTLSFSINGIKMKTVFRDLADKVYPAVSLSSFGMLRIKN